MSNQLKNYINQQLKNPKQEKFIRDLKTIFGQQIQLKSDHCLQKIKNIKYLLCVIDVFSKYACVKPLKDKNGKTVPNAFIKIVNESNRKPNKLWVNQGRKFSNKLMQE